MAASLALGESYAYHAAIEVTLKDMATIRDPFY